jgi:hypothetical protein
MIYTNTGYRGASQSHVGRLHRVKGRVALGEHEYHAGDSIEIYHFGQWLSGRVEYNLFNEPLFFEQGSDTNWIRISDGKRARRVVQ